MPRVSVPVTQITRAGVAAPTEANGDPTNGHVISNNGRTILLVRNSGTTDRTVTLRLPGLTDGQSITPRTVTVPASATRYIGPFPTDAYGTQLQVDVDNAELKLGALGF